MKEWQQRYAQRLESAKKQWMGRFEEFASANLDPVFAVFDEFATAQGFRVSSPACEDGTRIFKFALTENGYSIFAFRLRGLEEVQVVCEPYAPGVGRSETYECCSAICDADRDWVEQQFQNGLDRFIGCFAEAGTKSQLADA